MLSNLLGFDLRKEQRLTVTYAHGEQTSWVGLPPSFSTRLLENLPVVLKVQLYAAHAVPVGTPCYLSWSGTVSESGTISVSSQLGHLLPLPEGATVHVTPLDSTAVTEAKRVILEPASPDDWEVVELNADEIEGRLLEQCGVASAGRQMPIWVSGQMMAMKVASTEPAADCCRLVAGTEVAIAPRPRKANRWLNTGENSCYGRKEALYPVYLRVHLSSMDCMQSAPGLLGGKHLNDGPTMYIAPRTLERLRGMGHAFRVGGIVAVSSGTAKYKSDMLARIEVVEHLPLGHAVFEASMESTLKRYAVREFHRVQVKVKEGVSEFPPMFLDTFARRDSWVESDREKDGDASKTGSGHDACDEETL